MKTVSIKKILALLLAVALLGSFATTAAFAAESETLPVRLLLVDNSGNPISGNLASGSVVTLKIVSGKQAAIDAASFTVAVESSAASFVDKSIKKDEFLNVNGAIGLAFTADNYGAGTNTATSTAVSVIKVNLSNSGETSGTWREGMALITADMKLAKAMDATALTEKVSVIYSSEKDNYTLNRTDNNAKITPSTLVTSSGTGEYQLDISVLPTAVTVVSEPTFAEGWTFDGEEHALVTDAGEVTGGEYVFSLEQNGTYVTTDKFAKVTNAGSYTVYYKLQTEEGYIGSADVKSKTIEVAKAAIDSSSFPDFTYAENLVYDGTEQTLVAYDSSSLNGYTISIENEKATDAGTYQVVCSVKPDDNHTYTGDAKIDEGSVTISKAALDKLPTISGIDELVYNGENQTLVTVTDGTGFDITYSIDGEDNGAVIPQAKNAGTYSVAYVIRPDANHYLAQDVESSDEVKGSVEVTIAKKAVTVKAANKTASGTNAPAPTTVVEGTDYTVAGLVVGEKLGGDATLSYNYTNKTVSVEIKLPEASNYEIEKYETGTLTVSGSGSTGSGYIPGVGGGGSSVGGTSSSGTSTRSVTIAETTNGTVKVSTTTPALLANVTFKPEPAQGYKVGTVTVTDSNGNTVAVTPKANGTYSYRQPASNVTIKVTFIPSGESVPSKTKFTDVAAGAYYEDAVVWALNNNVTTGTSDTTFTPNGTVKRCEAVTFLWRAAGMPEPKNANNPFTDVPADEYYYKAVLWAVENGITKGTSETTFSPESTLQRDQLLTFLCRAAGSAEANGDNWSEASVTWANSNKLMEGAEGSFAAKDGCPRRDVVYYMWRYFTQK